mmetsp:Transcript_81254/g.226216  ORF Transcript_81254/g.226216 Transcript_81254/m.226216 type:complete len:267 (-) Transcript_81254:1421-2221(-)
MPKQHWTTRWRSSAARLVRSSVPCSAPRQGWRRHSASRQRARASRPPEVSRPSTRAPRRRTPERPRAGASCCARPARASRRRRSTSMSFRTTCGSSLTRTQAQPAEWPRRSTTLVRRPQRAIALLALSLMTFERSSMSSARSLGRRLTRRWTVATSGIMSLPAPRPTPAPRVRVARAWRRRSRPSRHDEPRRHAARPRPRRARWHRSIKFSASVVRWPSRTCGLRRNASKVCVTTSKTPVATATRGFMCASRTWARSLIALGGRVP